MISELLSRAGEARAREKQTANSATRPLNLANRLRENRSRLVEAAIFVVPLGMMTASIVFRNPLLLDWGVKGLTGLIIGRVAVAALDELLQQK